MSFVIQYSPHDMYDINGRRKIHYIQKIILRPKIGPDYIGIGFTTIKYKSLHLSLLGARSILRKIITSEYEIQGVDYATFKIRYV